MTTNPESTEGRPWRQPFRIRIVFDDHRLVANARLLLPATLAQHLGLRELVDTSGRRRPLAGAPGRAGRPTATVAPATAPPTATSSVETDREALVAFYNATNGENWNKSANWLSDAPMGEWAGVITNHDGRVTELRLFDNALSGEIPAELGSLSNLIWLDLESNRLSGGIPAELGSLFYLQRLYLGGKELSGEIPAELGSLSDLEYLFLRNNALSGEIPAELGSLSNLEYLFLRNNALSGCVPSSLEDQLDLYSSDIPSAGDGQHIAREAPARVGYCAWGCPSPDQVRRAGS